MTPTLVLPLCLAQFPMPSSNPSLNFYLHPVCLVVVVCPLEAEQRISKTSKVRLSWGRKDFVVQNCSSEAAKD